jgi:hypothetical protein
VHHRVDQRQVREGLGEVAEVAAGGGVELLGVELERGAERQQALAELPAALALADLQQRVDQPEGADQERALLPAQAVVR